MKVITEKRLREIFEAECDNGIVSVKDLLNCELQEIDTLTVSKLRPMCDADNYAAGAVLIALKGTNQLHEAYFNALGRVFVCDRYVMFDECIGWIPMPIYKPELAGDGE